MGNGTGSQVIVQVDRPGQKLDMRTIQRLLGVTGLHLDETYGPILINSKLGRYVVRGTVTPEARAKIEQIAGVRLFADGKVQTM